MACGLTPEEFRWRFPPIKYPLLKQCRCGKKLTFGPSPEWVECCQTYTHPCYVRPVEFYYSDQIVRDVNANHSLVDLVRAYYRGLFTSKQLDGPQQK